MHLSRLWTDTQENKEEKEGQCTKQRKRKGGRKEEQYLKRRGESTSAPVTSADRHTSAKKQNIWPGVVKSK